MALHNICTIQKRKVSYYYDTVISPRGSLGARRNAVARRDFAHNPVVERFSCLTPVIVVRYGNKKQNDELLIT